LRVQGAFEFEEHIAWHAGEAACHLGDPLGVGQSPRAADDLKFAFDKERVCCFGINADDSSGIFHE
jgi:hypothetical protein